MGVDDDDDAMECTLSTIDEINSGAMIQQQISSAHWEKILPTVKNGNMMEFEIETHDEYVELSRTNVEIKFRVKKGDGTNLAAGEKVSIINNIVGTMFRDIEVVINGETISYSSSNLAQRAMIEDLVSYGSDASTGWMQCGGFYKDTADQLDNLDPNPGAGAAVNEGLQERAELIAESKLVTVRGRLHLDIFNQPKPLVKNSRMVLRFQKNSDDYLIISNLADKFKVEIEEIFLHVRKCSFTPHWDKIVSGKTAIYTINRVIVKDFSCPAGGRTLIENNLHNGKLPTRVVLALINNVAYDGDYKRNPFNYKHYNASEVSLFMNGQLVDGKPLKFDYTQGDITDGFFNLYQNSGQLYRDEGNQIERSDFGKGYSLYVFDLTTSLCSEEFLDPVKKGKLATQFKFDQALPETITLSAYLEFDATIKINPVGSVVTNFD